MPEPDDDLEALIADLNRPKTAEEIERSTRWLHELRNDRKLAERLAMIERDARR